MTDELHRAFVDGGIVLDEPAAQPTQAEIEALVDSLKEGVRSCGMHDDGDTELFRIEDANDLMFEAATALTALQADLAAAVAHRDKMQKALEPFADMSIEGVVTKPTGLVTITTCAEYFHEARAALPDAKGGDAPINWRDDPSAIVEDDEPQAGRDYA